MAVDSIELDEGTLDIAGTNATAGERLPCYRWELRGASIQHVISSGSYRLQASNDGTIWENIDGGALTTSGMIVPTANYRYIRVFTTTAGDGEFYLHAIGGRD